MSRSNEIISSAHQLILERGYSGFSYADIAEQIGIKKASIHYYFPSKANLAQQVIINYRNVIQDNMRLLNSIPDPKDRVKEFILFWDKCLAKNPRDICLCAILISEIPILPEEIQDEIQAHFSELKKWLISTFESYGNNKENDSIERANLLLAGIHGGMLTSRIFNDSNNFHSIKNKLIKLATS